MRQGRSDRLLKKRTSYAIISTEEVTGGAFMSNILFANKRKNLFFLITAAIFLILEFLIDFKGVFRNADHPHLLRLFIAELDLYIESNATTLAVVLCILLFTCGERLKNILLMVGCGLSVANAITQLKGYIWGLNFVISNGANADPYETYIIFLFVITIISFLAVLARFIGALLRERGVRLFSIGCAVSAVAIIITLVSEIVYTTYIYKGNLIETVAISETSLITGILRIMLLTGLFLMSMNRPSKAESETETEE